MVDVVVPVRPPVPELPPPPQEATPRPTARATRANAVFHRPCLLRKLTRRIPIEKIVNSVTSPGARERPLGCCRAAGPTGELAAVVLTVSVVELVVAAVVSVADGALQVAPVGSPEQVKLIAPVNPLTAVTVKVMVPEAPGLDTVTAGLAEDR
jgi:hypothetical protein